MGIPEDIAIFEESLQELVIKYEQYFLGLEKRAPLQLLDEVERHARKYANISIVNTMLKFRYNSILARFNSYKQLWARTNRLMEEGKYSRDRFKMEMHKDKKREKPQVDVPPAKPETETLYQQYINARRSCNMPVNHITSESVANIIAQQKPGIVKKYRCDRVEFHVVIEKGVPKIKVRPKK